LDIGRRHLFQSSVDHIAERSLCYIEFIMSKREAPRRSRREERNEETRGELIAAAARVFARRGFHGASVEQIARQAGYSTGAIYWHFRDKDDLFLAVYEAFAASLAQDFEEIFRHGSDDLAEQAREAADRWMARLQRDPEFLILSHEFLVHAWRQPALREAFEHRLAGVRLALARVIRDRAEASGTALALSPEDTATVMRALGSALGLATLADPEAVRDGLFGDVLLLLFDQAGERQRPSRESQAVAEPARRTGAEAK
jgi:AcrR family transcriptional regulator